jgi:hypothetical protein
MRFARHVQLRRIALLLVLGAVVNVAVAWGCTLYHTHYMRSFLFQPTNSTPWPQDPPSNWRHSPTSYGALHSLGLTYEMCISSTAEDHPGGMVVITAGWPLRAFRCSGMSDGSTEVWSGVLKLSWPFSMHRVPLRPLWPGFAINTAIYAAILWMLFAAPGMIRHRRRIKRGLCPACGYPVGESAVCTECGKPVKPKRGEVTA